MSTAQFTCPLIVTIPGQVIASSLWNNEFINLFTNINPLGVGAYSDTDPQMQTTTDPFPSGSTSRPTALSGEIERIRYILNLIIGQTFWYNHPSISLETLNTSTPVIPSGTVMVFYQATAPTGWTGVSLDDYFLRVVNPGGAGGSTGGTGGLTPSTTISLAHSHTVNGHTHDLANHTHTMANHTHTGAAHTHTVSKSSGWGNSPGGSAGAGELVTTSGGGQTAAATNNTTGTTTPGASGVPVPNTSDTPFPNTSGVTSPTTDSQLNNQHFQYASVILASKN